MLRDCHGLCGIGCQNETWCQFGAPDAHRKKRSSPRAFLLSGPLLSDPFDHWARPLQPSSAVVFSLTRRGTIALRNCIVLLLFVLAGLGGQTLSPPDEAPHSIDSNAPVAQDYPINWVRTVDGWEPFSGIFSQPALPTPLLHPAVVTAGQVLVSAFALLAFSPAATAALGDQ